MRPGRAVHSEGGGSPGPGERPDNADVEARRTSARGFFLGAGAVRGSLETWALGFGFLLALWLLIDHLPPPATGNGLLILCGTSGLWAAFRTRLPSGRWPRQVLGEIAMGAALSAVMSAGLLGPAALLGWEELWVDSSRGGLLPVALLLSGVGPGYLAARFVLRLKRVWHRLRRRRMVWKLTHAHLLVVLIVGGLVGTVVLVLGPLQYTLADPSGAESLGVALVERIFRTLFPTGVAALALGAVILLAVLPPSALFSYLVARGTTRRLQKLAAATRALRAGEHGTRVEVEGEDELAQLQEDFNAMAARLEEMMAELQAERDKVSELLDARRELVAVVSHELRTPIATIRGYLDASQGRGSEAEYDSWERDIQVMRGEALRLQRLVDDLFTLSQAAVRELELDLRAVDPVRIIRERAETLALLAWERWRVELVVDLPESLPLAWADAGRLDQVLANLLRNAFRHTDPGGIVVVAAAARGMGVCVEVRDTGEGIPPEDLEHIWTRFYRGEAGRSRDARGAGLGLALVKDLVEAMDGRVSVESEVGHGSVFRVWLPAAPEEDALGVRRHRAAP